jgi:hypothetical protein
MKAGGMPAVDASPDEMTALLAYLGALGPHSPNFSTSVSQPLKALDASTMNSQTSFSERLNSTHAGLTKGF